MVEIATIVLATMILFSLGNQNRPPERVQPVRLRRDQQLGKVPRVRYCPGPASIPATLHAGCPPVLAGKKLVEI